MPVEKMNIEHCTQLSDAVLNELTSVWEQSVRSSHHFLTEADIDFFRPLVRSQYLPSVQLYLVRNDAGHVAAFMGLSDDMVEMLFVLPAEQGRGCGSLLLDYAVHTLGITRVDVNEDNTQAYGFYLHKGFTPIGRDATDPFGKPFPIIRLRYHG